MNYGLNLKQNGALDLVSLGALVHRLDPGIVPFRKATECQIHVSGGEYNVAANLADCFRLRTGIASAMVDYPIGDLIAGQVRAMGVIPFYKRFPHNGVNGPNMATVFSDRGHGVRAPVVFYNRANEAAAQLKPGDFDLCPAAPAAPFELHQAAGVGAHHQLGARRSHVGHLFVEQAQRHRRVRQVVNARAAAAPHRVAIGQRPQLQPFDAFQQPPRLAAARSAGSPDGTDRDRSPGPARGAAADPPARPRPATRSRRAPWR